MKRDMELIRTILLRIEESDNEGISVSNFPDDNPRLVNYHIGLVMESGLAKGKEFGSDGDPSSYELFELTWEGHDFFDSIRRDDIWHKVKENLRENLSRVPFLIIKSVATRLLQQDYGIFSV